MIGIDIHQELLDMAMSRAREGGHVMDLVLASAEHLPFAEESFDGAICVDVLEHVADDKGVLRQIHGALKGSGKLYFSAPNVFWLLSSHTSIYERLLRLYKFLGSSSRRSAYEESERSYSYFELTPLIVSQGFHDLRVLPPSVEFADFFDEPLRTIARIFYGPISALRLMNVFQPGFAVVCSKGGS
jgi:ubiquinone/menaquinone biosynthesis C-methylase UbiE